MTDPYTEVADYIASRVTLLDFGAWLVKLALDDRETTELLTYDKDDGFVWDNDWYEGERDVKVIDFVDANDVDPSMRWHSIKVDGLPNDGQVVWVTYCYERDYKEASDSHRWHKGKWQEFVYNDWEDVALQDAIIAWMPYPAPYEGN